MALLSRDIDATPAPLPEGMIACHSVSQEPRTDYNLDASPMPDGASIETKVFENGEDDVDPSKIVKSFRF